MKDDTTADTTALITPNTHFKQESPAANALLIPHGEVPHKSGPKYCLVQTLHGQLATTSGDHLSTTVRIIQRKKREKKQPVE